jgi:hypothetical protein
MRTLTAALLALSVSAALAQTPQDDGIQAGETYAHLVGATILPRAAAEQLSSRCAADSPALAAPARAAFGEWQKRNAALEVAATRLYQNVGERIGSEIGADTFNEMRARIDETLRKGSTVLVQTLFTEVFGGLAPNERELACRSMFTQMGDGRFDIERIQPQGYRLIAEGTTLIGHWKIVETTLQLADGSTSKNPPQLQCTLDFTVTSFTSACDAPDGSKFLSISRYMLAGPGKYRAEVVENKRTPQTVGVRSTAEYGFADNDRLLLTVYPPVQRNAGLKTPVKAVSEWQRIR